MHTCRVRVCCTRARLELVALPPQEVVGWVGGTICQRERQVFELTDYSGRGRCQQPADSDSRAHTKQRDQQHGAGAGPSAS